MYTFKHNLINYTSELALVNYSLHLSCLQNNLYTLIGIYIPFSAVIIIQDMSF